MQILRAGKNVRALASANQGNCRNAMPRNWPRLRIAVTPTIRSSRAPQCGKTRKHEEDQEAISQGGAMQLRSKEGMTYQPRTGSVPPPIWRSRLGSMGTGEHGLTGVAGEVAAC
jgi:hypothetical protein